MTSLIDVLSEEQRKALDARWAEAVREEAAARRASGQETSRPEPKAQVNVPRTGLLTCRQFGQVLAARQAARRRL